MFLPELYVLGENVYDKVEGRETTLRRLASTTATAFLIFSFIDVKDFIVLNWLTKYNSVLKLIP